MNMSGWYGILVRVAAPIILLSGVIAFFLLPRVLLGRITLNEARAHFFEAAEEIGGLQALRQTLSRISQGELEALFIPKDRPLAFVEALETLAIQSGTTMDIVFLDSASVRSSAPAKQSLAGARAFEVRLKGSFEGTMRFLAALERQPALLRVDGVTMQSLAERAQARPTGQSFGQALSYINTVIRVYAPTLE
jgi:hypothetical protein